MMALLSQAMEKDLGSPGSREHGKVMGSGQLSGSLAVGMSVVTAGQGQGGRLPRHSQTLCQAPTVCQAPCWVLGCSCEREKDPVLAELISE